MDSSENAEFIDARFARGNELPHYEPFFRQAWKHAATAYATLRRRATSGDARAGQALVPAAATVGDRPANTRRLDEATPAGRSRLLSGPRIAARCRHRAAVARTT